MLDDNPSTVYRYTGWRSKRTDDIPEMTFYFSNETLTAVWMRAGDYSSRTNYFGNAFPTKVRLRIHHSGGSYSDYAYNMEDRYDTTSVNSSWQYGYQCLGLPVTLTNVSRVEIFIGNWRGGSSKTNEVSVSDVVFQRPAGSPYGAVVPTPTPYRGGYDSGNVPYGSGYRATLTMRLATRSGPSTTYDELGSYFQAGTGVTVLSKAWDSRNGIWWVQVEFSYGGQMRRAYTGLKRVNIDPGLLREETPLGYAWVNRTTTAYYGPGTYYTAHRYAIPYGTYGTVYARENNYVQLEFTDNGKLRRVWVYAGDVSTY